MRELLDSMGLGNNREFDWLILDMAEELYSIEPLHHTPGVANVVPDALPRQTARGVASSRADTGRLPPLHVEAPTADVCLPRGSPYLPLVLISMLKITP